MVTPMAAAVIAASVRLPRHAVRVVIGPTSRSAGPGPHTWGARPVAWAVVCGVRLDVAVSVAGAAVVVGVLVAAVALRDRIRGRGGDRRRGRGGRRGGRGVRGPGTVVV